MENTIQPDKREWVPITKQQTDELFDSLSLMIGGRDVIPMDRAVDATSKEAVFHVVRLYGGCKGSVYSEYGIGDPNPPLWYITRKGFDYAVTYENVKATLGSTVGVFNDIIKRVWDTQD